MSAEQNVYVIFQKQAASNFAKVSVLFSRCDFLKEISRTHKFSRRLGYSKKTYEYDMKRILNLKGVLKIRFSRFIKNFPQSFPDFHPIFP